jgi:hypothetical protein
MAPRKNEKTIAVIWTSTMTNIKIQKLFVIGDYFFYLTNKETTKNECVITFPDNFIYSGGHLCRRPDMPDTFFEGDHPRIISAKFG